MRYQGTTHRRALTARLNVLPPNQGVASVAYTSMVIIALVVLALTYAVGELLTEGRIIPSRKKRKGKSDDSVSDDR